MQPIVPSLKPGDSNPQIANLIEALLLLVRQGEIRASQGVSNLAADASKLATSVAVKGIGLRKN